MENKKKIIIVISILLIYFVIMVIIYGVGRVKNKFYHIEILMAPNTYLEYQNGRWKDVVDDYNDLLGKSYKIYQNNTFLYDGILQYTNEKWYAFDKNNKPLSLPDNFLAYRGNTTLDIANYNTKEMTDSEIIEAKTILRENNITFEPSFVENLKIEADINQDGKNETIYIISNTLGMDEQSKYFSIAYIKENNKIETLISDVSENMLEVPTVHLKGMIDYNKDKKYELFFEKIYFDQIGTCHEIFAQEENTYKSVKACELIKRGDE